MRAAPVQVQWGDQDDAEEWANTLTHGFGLAATLAYAGWMLPSLADAPRLQLGAGLYLATVAAVFASSTAYHKAVDPGWKRLLNTLDRVAIHCAIAGAVTPFVLAQGNDASLVAVWGAAGGGIAYESGWGVRFERIATALYLTVGAAVIGAASSTLGALGATELAWITGGVAAILGGLVFFWLRNVRYHHTIWHLFVLAGLGAHTVAVHNVVLPG